MGVLTQAMLLYITYTVGSTLYSAESLAEFAKVVAILGIDRQPCWQEYADHHDGDDEKGDENLWPLELPNAAELAAGCTKSVRISAPPRAASDSDADEALSIANDTGMQPPSRYSLAVEQQDVQNDQYPISGRILSGTLHGGLERSLRRRKHSLTEADLASPQPAAKRRDCHSEVSHGFNANIFLPSRTASPKPSNYELPPGSNDAALIWEEIARLHQGLDSTTADNIALREKVDASEADNIDLRQRADASEADNIALCRRVDASEADNIALRQRVDASEADNIALRKRVDASEAKINAQDVDRALLQEALAREREQNRLLLQRVDKLEESHKSCSPISDKIYRIILENTIKTDELAKSHQKGDEALLKTQADVEECQAGVEECHETVEEHRADLEQCRSGIEDCHKVVEECQAGMEEYHKVVEKCRTGIEECQVAVGNFPADLDRVKVDFGRIVETSMRKSDDRFAKELRDGITSHRKDTTRSLRDMNQKVQKALEETKRLTQQCSDENLNSMVRQKVASLFELTSGFLERGLQDRN
ncbi:hypothetical protein MY11210_006442 [Beauveria gryllotalpidicola]